MIIETFINYLIVGIVFDKSFTITLYPMFVKSSFFLFTLFVNQYSYLKVAETYSRNM